MRGRLAMHASARHSHEAKGALHVHETSLKPFRQDACKIHLMDNGEQLYTEAVTNEEAQTARAQLCHVLADALNDYGVKLFAAGNAIAGGPAKAKDPELKDMLERVIGLSCTIQIAGELASACIDLLHSSQFYASYALVRQIVECEYLCRAFSQDQDEARKWLNTTRDERLRFWSPKRMRQKSEGEFRDKDYAVHCEVGGHPTPRAFMLLRPSRTMPSNAVWTELTIHLANVWSHTTRAIPELVMPLLDRKPGPQGKAADVTAKVNYWLSNDPVLKAVAQLPDFPTLQ